VLNCPSFAPGATLERACHRFVQYQYPCRKDQFKVGKIFRVPDLLPGLAWRQFCLQPSLSSAAAGRRTNHHLELDFRLVESDRKLQPIITTRDGG
jgi:hypothetical protein